MFESRIANSLKDRSWENLHAAGEGHHLTIGPGPEQTVTWITDGLELPDLPSMRQYRVDRTIAQLEQEGYDGLIVLDPMNIRYVSDTTNMQLWVMHNATRYAWIGTDGHVVVWDYTGCEFLSGHSHVIAEVRPAIGLNYFSAGDRRAEQARRWAAEMTTLITERHGTGANIAIDGAPIDCYRHLEAAGITIGDGQRVMEQARRIKGPDEIRAMRCSVHACEAAMSEMLEAMEPGMTERDLWAILHAGNIRRGGEWIETQILASGPRTNPWMQEASARVLEAGDMMAYDTDLVGPYGMMTDISRSWVVGDVAPNAHQATLFDMATEQLDRNKDLLTPGTTFRDLSHKAWFPPIDEYRHYSCLFHGVGQCDELPCIYFPHAWEDFGYEGVVEPGMCFTVESFIGPRSGGEGIKLENQYVVTETGPELLSHFPLGLTR
ncbi:MAG: Xaa-Pro peptidase family protein [Actinomycetota bacterium]